MGKQKAREARAWSEEKRGRIKQLTIKLQEDPQNLDVQLKLQEVKEKLAVKEEEKARWIQKKLDIKWMQNGDIPSRVFVGLFKARRNQMEIKSLLDETNTEVEDERRMCKLAEEHFHKLLTEEKIEEERLPDIRYVLQRVKSRVTEEDKALLEKPWEEEELKIAASIMKTGKSPVADGTPQTDSKGLHITTKAFDSVSWRFLIDTLKTLNFGEKFQGYTQAILSNAASSVVINGRRSRPVEITRSVRQGCPLSPLLFILVTQTLTEVLEGEVCSGAIQGIFLQLANVHYCLGLFADDFHVIFAASEESARNMKAVLDIFAWAMGLLIQWKKSTARWIGPGKSNRPEWTAELAWSWKEDGETTKLLGFIFDEGIKGDAMVQKCKEKITRICTSPLYKGLLICGRVTIANATILGAFWYYLPLWAGTWEDIEKIEKSVVNFVWSGNEVDTRHRASKQIIEQKKSKGGLGLVSMSKQYMVFASRTIRWAFQPGFHPMKKTIRGLLENLSMGAFGSPGVQWIYNPARLKTGGLSTVMANLFTAWGKMTPWLQHGRLHLQEDWRKIPIWGSAQCAWDGKIRRIDSQAKRLLWETGYKQLGDLTIARDDEMASWDTKKLNGVDTLAVRKAFEKLRISTFFKEAQDKTEGWTPAMNHILLADRLPIRLRRSASWWEVVRGAACWVIWLGRNANTFANERWHAKKTDSAMWYRFTLYTTSEWHKINGVDQAAEREAFKINWAFEYTGTEIDATGKLVIPRQPPWNRRDGNVGDREEPA
ncbi:hypothetical protein R1sor_008387 [Riccia sorocarpa]|uniref:Reverse transcriptase domain-containing protein n=1 Tax=Riccia sorocarpa TaxID=122646 RepID=A0ABD3HXE4_9MARC